MQKHVYDISYGIFLKSSINVTTVSEIIVHNPTGTIFSDETDQYQGKG